MSQLSRTQPLSVPIASSVAAVAGPRSRSRSSVAFLAVPPAQAALAMNAVQAATDVARGNERGCFEQGIGRISHIPCRWSLDEVIEHLIRILRISYTGAMNVAPHQT
ncbi:hypothetical protein J2W35_005576 [Variovorax boronicumulans]|uniref:hypothetical protein n=1 Tax=Variovorax boronicumulans TaxID=436515 RepID=UPI0027872031|nr:hypothetical protein [Variovorax boronicumulans]MDQ0085197.1 hypothetical protein [Variovorax boronicumulans]